MDGHGLDVAILAVGGACVALWALAARRLASWNVSSAIAMVALGLVLANPPFGVLDISPTSETVRHLTELALALVLFADASRVSLRSFRADPGLPSRLLLIGLPLTIGAGFIAAMLLTDLDPWLCAVIATALAPTDAALGAPVVADRRVPIRTRRTLNVESGLNDGLATPLVTFFLAGAVTEAGTAHAFTPTTALADLGIGLLVGAAIGFGGGQLLAFARRHEWTTASSIAILVPTLALVSYFVALELEANGFIAAFVGGLAFGSTQRDAAEIGEFGEQLGELLGLSVWLIFGALIIDLVDDLTVGIVVFALLSLTVLRMVPVAIATIGGGLSRSTVVFIGWFGPRGLASIVFGVIALDALPPEDGAPVISMIALTVLLSVVLHGVTARPFSRRYGEREPADGPDETGDDESFQARRLGEHHGNPAVNP